jgi:hypothetical protein
VPSESDTTKDPAVLRMRGGLDHEAVNIQSDSVPCWYPPIGPIERQAQDMRGRHVQGASMAQLFLRRVALGE